ncbi:T9SS type A sorting domain-containing protein, partial [bacterium]|nr:T9SS type A sorting domain-containing protein [bacterium]
TGRDSTWSTELWSFSTAVPERPGSFSLLSPPNGSSFTELPFDLVWEESSDPDPEDTLNYEVEFALDDMFRDPIVVDAGRNTTFTVDSTLELEDLSWHFWRVRAVDGNTEGRYSDQSWYIELDLFVKGLNAEIPEVFELAAVYPNPVNASTTIRVALPARDQVMVRVVNILGQEIANLYHGTLPAGYHELHWSPTIASGVYFVALQGKEQGTDLKKIVIMK